MADKLDYACDTSDSKSDWAIKRSFAKENTSLQRVLMFYAFVFVIAFAVLHFLVCIRPWSAIIVALILSQVYLNAVCSPIRVDMWSEFDSSVGIYGLIQVGTPIAVFIYAIASAIKDTDKPPKRVQRAVVLEPPLSNPSS